jgi:hypothetical protein
MSPLGSPYFQASLSGTRPNLLQDEQTQQEMSVPTNVHTNQLQRW